MSASPHVFDVGATDFVEKVVEPSRQVPVLVDFWAAWCAPCRSLGPVLEKIAREAGGALKLAKVDTEAEPGLASHFGIRSLPTVMLVVDGEIRDHFMGALPEAEVRAFLARWTGPAGGGTREKVAARLIEGDTAGARSLVEQAIAEQPEDPELPLELARIAVAEDRFDEAEGILDGLRADVKASDPARALRGALAFARAVEGAPPEAELAARVAGRPDDLEAWYGLGARRIVRGDAEGALEAFLEIMRRDRGFRDDLGRSSMVQVFELQGIDPAVVARFRKRMASMLF